MACVWTLFIHLFSKQPSVIPAWMTFRSLGVAGDSRASWGSGVGGEGLTIWEDQPIW